jgi:hypothetical protein
LALTGGWLFLGGFWAEPRWQMRAQLFRLDRVKSICEMMDSSQRFCRDASRDYQVVGHVRVTRFFILLQQGFTFRIQSWNIGGAETARN